jgi:hypothetical protein
MADLLAEAMQALYAVGPDEFMATRGQLVAAAKAGSDKSVASEIGKLRKPSVAAWAVNLTARVAPDVVDELVDLGAQMRQAQSRLDALALTGMRKERDAAVDAFVAAATDAVQEAGRSLSPAAQQEVRATAIAALADEQASTAVASGQLTRALSYSGFGEVDLSEAVARTASGAILTVVRGSGGRARAGSSGRATDAAERARGGGDGEEAATDASSTEVAADLAALESRLQEAEQAFAKAEAAVTRARERAEETRERLAVVERQLAKAREADERALEGVTDAVRARKQADAARQRAERELRDARLETQD